MTNETERLKRVGLWAALPLGVLALNYIVLPVMPGGRVAPPGVLVNGLYVGLLTALTTAGIILVYRSSRAINFAQIALGAGSAALIANLVGREILPFFVAMPAALILGALVGAILGFAVVTLFWRLPRLVLTVATIILLGNLFSIQGWLDARFRQPGERIGSLPVLGPFPDNVLPISGFPFRTFHLLGFIIGIASLIGLAIFFRKSRIGIAIRASSEDADRASLLGINVKAVSIIVWTIAGFFSAVASVFGQASVIYTPGEGADPISLMVPLTAAVIGRMTNLPVAVAAAFGIALVNETVKWSFAEVGFVNIGLFAILLGTLLLQKAKTSVRQTEASSWRAIQEVRSVPRELDALPLVGITRRVLMGMAGLFAVALPLILDQGSTNQWGLVYVFALLGFSLVVMTGWAGQISLGHYAFLAVGAFVGGVVSGTWGWSFWPAVPIACAAGAGFAVLVGIPALRIKGLFLAVTTLAMAIMFQSLISSETLLGRFIPESVERPKLLFFNFDDERSYYYLMLVVFALAGLMARSLRRSRTGRVLIATREDEAGARSFGIDVRRAHLSAFALSGALAALAGVLFVHHQRGFDVQSYGASISLFVFVGVVVGGLGALTGGFLAALYYIGLQQIPGWLAAPLGQILPLAVIVFVPGGFVQMLYGMRDGILRVIAMRRHIVVPSLFADYSPDAWEKRLTPLAAPLPNRGLAALGPEQRYSLDSRLWGSDKPEKVTQ